MPTNILQLAYYVLGALIAAGFGAFVVGWFNKGKTQAETEQIATNVYKGLNSDLLQQLKDTRSEAAQLRLDIRLLNERLSKMEELDEEKDRELKSKNERIIELERRVDELEIELSKHRTPDEIIDLATNVLHTKLEEGAVEIKSNLNH